MCYVDKPMVKITTVTVGCDYVNISWAANDECNIFFYNITLLFVTRDSKVTATMITAMSPCTFTGLPADTQVNITVAGISKMQDVLSFNSTSVRTIASESMYQYIQILQVFVIIS